ncbi:MAG TPA: hypothetical protein VFQ41_00460 [Candidatus Angelobacter sp.]|nr:hypothetical protein [Candidatus Angelobacter sp.]
MPRTSISKAEWLGALETAAQLGVEQSSAVWVWIMQELRLGPQSFLAIREAVQQGRWRTAKNPKTYIKTVARREALKMGLVDEGSGNLVTIGSSRTDGEEISGEEALEYMGHQYERRQAAKGTDGVWRAGAGAGRDYGDPREQHESYRDWLVSAVPTGLTVVQQPSQEHKRLIDRINDSTGEVHFHARPLVRPNWREWAREAGLDKWEKRVLDYRLSGASREHAMAAQPDEESRKALQAAWKRFDRNGMERLRAAAKNVSPRLKTATETRRHNEE